MIDIKFFEKTHELKKRIMAGEKIDKRVVFDLFEENRSQSPAIYNIETTNACNMECRMCPRTTMMTRPVSTMPQSLFSRIVDQIEPFSEEEWGHWQDFVEDHYGVDRNAMSENHFFLHIIPKVIQLHGYGDPLLDKDMPQRLTLLSQKGFLPYFSCNPANIDIDLSVEMMKSGLAYIKYSIESVDDETHKKIRGEASNFQQSFEKIQQLLEIKKEGEYKTVFVITMLDLGRFDQVLEFKKLKESFKDLDVYIYLKSQDQQWYEKKDVGTKSVHWSEICQHPWMSMTIKSDGRAAMCMEDFNNEIILGDVKSENLTEIWNGKKYHEFRVAHFNGAKGLKCDKECDMKLVGDFFSS